MKTFVSLFAIMAAGAASANLVTNGTFEANAFPANGYSLPSTVSAWSQVGQIAGIGSGYLGAPSQEIDLSGTTDNTSGTGLSQSLTTVAGQQYKLMLDVYTGGDRGHNGGVDVFVGSTVLGNNLQGNTRTGHTLYFTASGTSTFLSLLSNNGRVSHIDNVSVEAVPEPASMAALALGGLGILRRRRKA